MLGIALLFIGAVLVVNGVGLTGRIEARENAVFNFLIGMLALFISLLGIIRSVDNAGYLSVAAGLLFAFTYLYLAVVQWKGMSGKGLGWYCLFVAINTLPMAWMAMAQDMRSTVMWLAWGLLWFLFFLALALQKNIRSLGIITVIIGVASCWIPGFLMLADRW
ncbi:AmiS/UreI family transporter [Collimonas sp. NPDC087041]|uniref:AmiS/UreI transporter family protein n=1 Tax=Collimonas arenae TaxID=279058 RepID=A0A127QGU5_9BURK|nr:AmiS/UreI family transporter [Collimonas arenae]AMO99321.1 amiS/UreI transporter family protein [Collimonas arenae]AMP09224.1 amiS/UreI transporter family protein [Collimonas arenae]